MFSNPLILFNYKDCCFYIYDFFASSIKKTCRIINEQFLLCKNNQRKIYENYLQLTPSYCVVILD